MSVGKAGVWSCAESLCVRSVRGAGHCAPDQGIAPEKMGIAPEVQGIAPEKQGIAPEGQGIVPEEAGHCAHRAIGEYSGGRGVLWCMCVSACVACCCMSCCALIKRWSPWRRPARGSWPALLPAGREGGIPGAGGGATGGRSGNGLPLGHNDLPGRLVVGSG